MRCKRELLNLDYYIFTEKTNSYFQSLSVLYKKKKYKL